MKPNILFILTDDQNEDTLGCFGGKVLTPALDKLCREGVKFTRAYNSSSVCTPSRYSCLTGQYASRCSTAQFMAAFPAGTQTHVGFNVQVEPGSFNVGRVLHDNGYFTGFVGKWHTGVPRHSPYPSNADLRDPKTAAILAQNQRQLCEHIRKCGFDYAASVYRGNLKDHKLDALIYHNMEWVTKGALDFLDQCEDKPFYLHLATTLQHGPPPQKSIGGDPCLTPAGLLSQPLQVQAPRSTIAERLRKAGLPESVGHATWLDDGIAAVIQKLEKLGKLDNTVIIFYSDNSTHGGKGTCYEGGARTPAFIWWKGYFPEGVVCDKLIQNIDWVPTIFDLAGTPTPAQMKIDGQSLVPLVTAKATAWRDAVFFEVGHTRAVCTERWKYFAVRYPPALQERIRNNTLGRPPYHMDTPIDLQKMAIAAHPAYWDADQLYDLRNDPDEKINVIQDPKNTASVAQLKTRLKEWLADFNRPFGELAP